MKKQPPTLLLSESNIRQVFENQEGIVVSLIEDALKKRIENKVILPEKSSQIFNTQTQDRINCMPGSIVADNISGLKWVAVFPGNPQVGYENITGTIVLSELQYGHTISVMDGTYITSIRTAGVGAVAAKYLSKEDATAIGFIGAGREARKHLDMIKIVRPNISVCYVSSRNRATVDAFILEEREKYPEMIFVACGNDYENAVKDADIIVTATSAQSDLLKAKWIKNGALYIHVGGWEDEYAVPKKASKIICDEWERVKHRTQTISRMYKEGLLCDDDIYADLAEITNNIKTGRKSTDEFIYFCSVGLGFLDIAIADYAYKHCKEKCIGKYYQF